MNNKTTQISLILILSALAIGMISAAAVPLLEQQHAKALNFNFGGGNFFHVNPKGHVNLKFGGFHIH